MSYPFDQSAWNGLVERLPRLPHAMLVHGPRGIGKLALATRFSQYLLCEARAGSQPCGRCEGCRWFLDGNHPDFRLIQPESMAEEAGEAEEGAEIPESTGKKAKPSTEIKVGQIRALSDFLYVGSHRGARRIALVHPAEAMNLNAANSLLKALEEPPPGAVFILVTHAFGRLLPTVRSRCVKVAVAPPDLEASSKWLKQEGIPDAERWLAFAGGAPLLARDLASGERAGEIRRLTEQLAAGQRPAGINTREALELLAEVLQKMALDAAIGGLGGQARYSTWGSRRPAGSPQRWLGFARDMGRNRALARRPLNPGLFAEDLLSRFPGLS